ncbi:Entericidin EcnAB [Sphingopyxis alaskensis RB2256]|uniref:Entericidin EcnAB n=1 Tax=Sphingopyxis alaskensis (strain DSM 13593 / LMG 18877 / RB2256) TaxID=317655 RepID=Q1GU10_SPHAL|nr:Entericidin EcnAB [Sphingopyxis alaskensis RB2256]
MLSFFSGTNRPGRSFPVRAAVIAPPQRCSATLARPAFPPPLEACRAILHQDMVRGEKMTGFRAILLALLASFLVAGCNTVKGVGRDIESVGEAGDRAI